MTVTKKPAAHIVIVSDIRTIRDAIDDELRSAGYDGIVDRFSFSTYQPQGVTSSAPDLIFVCAQPCDGVPFVQTIRRTHATPRIGVLATSDADDGEFIAWAAIGICGYIESDAPVDLVASTVLQLVAGETVFPRRLSALLLHQFGRRQNTAATHDAIGSLTFRELAVLEMLDEGLSNKQIASCLAITSATVKNHVHNILTKLDVSSRGSAAAYVRRVAPTAAHRGAQRQLQTG